MGKIALAIHGGAGTILRSDMTPQLEAEYRSGLQTALDAGWVVLTDGGTSMDAVAAAVCSLEDFPLFNAGRGSVFTHDGKNEMDACIMDGSSLKAGAIAVVKNVKNPINLARLVMQRTPHIMLAGLGANEFARQCGVEMADDAYFYTEHRYQQMLKARAEHVVELDHTAPKAEIVMEDVEKAELENVEAVTAKPMGTVGAVACDEKGHLAAATSTGGMTNKKFGRVGDTPLVGLGTYANDLCAVSCTGYGEYFILGVTAYDVAARMRYKSVDLPAAAGEAIDFLTSISGEGGLIAVDANGNIAMPFNSSGMYRASISSSQGPDIGIYA